MQNAASAFAVVVSERWRNNRQRQDDPRATDIGLKVGVLPTGPLDAITMWPVLK